MGERELAEYVKPKRQADARFRVKRYMAREIGRGMHLTESTDRVRTILSLLPSGRNFFGMESQVFRPMMTAFIRPGVTVVLVNFLKYAMSPLKGGRMMSAPYTECTKQSNSVRIM
jgi:hypothetical protein